MRIPVLQQSCVTFGTKPVLLGTGFSHIYTDFPNGGSRAGPRGKAHLGCKLREPSATAVLQLLRVKQQSRPGFGKLLLGRACADGWHSAWRGNDKRKEQHKGWAVPGEIPTVERSRCAKESPLPAARRSGGELELDRGPVPQRQSQCGYRNRASSGGFPQQDEDVLHHPTTSESLLSNGPGGYALQSSPSWKEIRVMVSPFLVHAC